MSVFFYHFSFDASNYFFEENEYDTHFFNSSFLFTQIRCHFILKKNQNEKLFLYFFRNSKHTFFTSNNQTFSNPNDVVKFIDIKRKDPFFQFFQFFDYLPFLLLHTKYHLFFSTKNKIKNFTFFLHFLNSNVQISKNQFFEIQTCRKIY